MKQILKYLFFILFGIILYHILDNTINKFNIGANSIAWRELKPNINRNTARNEDYNYYYYYGYNINDLNDIYTRLRADGFDVNQGDLYQVPLFPTHVDTYDVVDYDEEIYNLYTPDLRRENLIPPPLQFGTNPQPNVIRPVPLVQHPGGLTIPVPAPAPAQRSWWQRLCASSARN